jgi:MoaA/NifB/PqqE/SkfB family radical SAM enzyme
MCDSWRLKPGKELTPSDVHGVFEKIGRLDVVRLTGGEPFLREDFAEVARAVLERSQPRVLHVTTNGSFPERVERFVQEFPDPRRLRFLVSFDGLQAEHDRNRGREVTFDRACTTVGLLHDFRRLGVRVSVNHTVISAQSLNDAAELKARFAANGTDVQSVLAYSDSSMYSIKLRGKAAEHLIVPTGYPLHPALEGADVLGFVDQELRAAEKIADPVLRVGKRYYLRGLRARLRREPAPHRPRCVAVRSHLRLLPDGSVPVCQFNTEVIGNLRESSFDEVWHSEAALKARGWVDRCPGCWAECEVMPSALFTGDIWRGLVPPALTASG